jgi:predicted transcriptional regulator/predicted nucleic acid-binding protein/GNAT superfamily N-acetyltransferase
MKVEVIHPRSPQLSVVKLLGKASATTLGFLPEGAFDDYANRRQIIVALDDDGETIGYLIYRVSNSNAIIVHLCVANQWRHKGAAKALVNKLRQVTQRLHGIGLRCRRDYEANKVWPRLDFVAQFDQPGRGKDRKDLTFWWLDHGHPNLFTSAALESLSSKLCVVVDANVFFDLTDASRVGHEESSSLLADWLSENLELCLTDEIFNDINRSENKNQRRTAREMAKSFTRLPCPPAVFDTVSQRLTELFPKTMSERDESDLRQLARTIASNVKFFVTRDGPLLNLADRVFDAFGVSIIRPADFIVRLDELEREREYQPVRLAGTLSEVQLVHSGQEALFTTQFQAPSVGESKTSFQQRLRPLLANPKRYECHVTLNTEKEPIALFAYDNHRANELGIPMLRVGHTRLASTLARHLVFHCVAHSAHEGRTFTRVTDPFIDTVLATVLSEDGFVPLRSQWLKVNLPIAEASKELAKRLLELPLTGNEARHFVETAAILKNDTAITNARIMADIERILWPAKITDAYIPSFIVPIQPKWAMELFDEGLANQTLFGATDELALNRESVYYRSRLNSGGLKSPGRILWYVSAKGRYLGASKVRACSRINEVIIDKPKNLYRRFKRLGVYKWNNVYQLADKNIENEIMALRFSDTELFPNPVSLTELREILKQEGIKTQLQSPTPVSPGFLQRSTLQEPNFTPRSVSMPGESLLLSIQPEFAHRIFTGTKKVELRRVRPKLEESDWVIVYVSTPVRAVVGAFQVDRIVEALPNRLWRIVRHEAGVTRKEFELYYAGASNACGIFFKKTMTLSHPVELAHLRRLWAGFHPPQSFRYLTEADVKRIESFSKQTII